MGSEISKQTEEDEIKISPLNKDNKVDNFQ
jgi:hypothetical protein